MDSLNNQKYLNLTNCLRKKDKVAIYDVPELGNLSIMTNEQNTTKKDPILLKGLKSVEGQTFRPSMITGNFLVNNFFKLFNWNNTGNVQSYSGGMIRNYVLEHKRELT